MIYKKQLITGVILVFLVIGGMAAMAPSRSKHKNLKILPKDISEPMLDSIMNSYTKALGTDCSFCHSSVNNFPDSLDFAADGNEMKENARKMLRMTIDINKNNFYFDKSIRSEYLNTVTCNTCHRGQPFPTEETH